MKILIIEDDRSVQTQLAVFLQGHGYEVDTLEDFTSIFPYIEQSKPHLLLLDLNLPHLDGYTICRRIRESSNVPIIVITSRDTELDELMSMNLGADDFVRKPFNTQILLLRIERLLKRVYDQNSQVVEDGALRLDLTKATLHYEDKTEVLTKNEMLILHYFLTHKNQIITRETLMLHLWSTESFIDDNTLSVNISRLRKKLISVGMEDPIQTKRNMGYIML